MRRLRFGLPALLMIVIALFVIKTSAAAQEADHGLIIGLEGPIELQPTPAEAFRPAAVLDFLGPGAVLRTGDNGRVKIFFPPDTVLTLDAQSSLALETDPTLRPVPGKIGVKFLFGTLHFLVSDTSSRSNGRLYIQGATALIEPKEVQGVLATEVEDRLICLAGQSGLSVTNRVSNRRLQLRPGQMAVSTPDGILELARLEADQVKQSWDSPKMVQLPPPPTVLQPPTPANTPITLAEQVKQPWPVFPPVHQSPNLWIKEIYGGRQIRPNPRP